MGHKMRLPRFSSSWLIAFAALSALPLLTSGLIGQTHSHGEDLIPRHQSQEFSVANPIMLKPVMVRGSTEGASDRAKAGNVRGSLRGMRVQVEIHDPMSGTIT